MVVGYFALCRLKFTLLATPFLVLSSLFFYAYWDIRYLPILLFSLATNSAMVHFMHHTSGQKRRVFGMAGAVAFNLVVLGYFKYANFLADILASMDLAHWPRHTLALPLGISFFTFQQIAYVIDAYHGRVIREGFLKYVLFIVFFPQLIAGPIVHHLEMMPQFRSLRHFVFRPKACSAGLYIFSLGLFKKVMIADYLSIWASVGFSHVEQPTAVVAWGTVMAYTFQLYFDFSGYSDMAMGIGRMFNIHLPNNFNSPYKATNIQEFWRRWHITLSHFLQDYIYKPLGGNRKGRVRTCVNLFATFIIGGIWHGAGWTFIIWGALHGSALVVHRLFSRSGLRLPSVVGWTLTFLWVAVAWVFFRADSLGEALEILRGMCGVYGWREQVDVEVLRNVVNVYGTDCDKHIQRLFNGKSFKYLAGLLVVCLCFKNSYERGLRFRANVPNLLITLVLLILCSCEFSKTSEFLYFNF